MGPVAVVVDISGVHTTGVLARSVERWDVCREVAAESAGEVRRDVGVATIYAGVDDPDEHAVTALGQRWASTRVLRSDLSHVPLVAGQGLGTGRRLDCRAGTGVRVRLVTF